MNKVFACIDGLSNTACVVDWASWAALRLDAPLAFLHVLAESSMSVAPTDLSGAIGLGAQEELLEELSDLDQRRSSIAAEQGRRLLEGARARAAAAGVAHHEGHLRQGELVEAAAYFEGETRLLTMGEHRRGLSGRPGYLDHRVEAMVRYAKRPVLVITADQFAPPARAVIAFDGSPTSQKVVQAVADSPLLQGLPLLLVTVGDDTPQVRHRLSDAQAALSARGFMCECRVTPGAVEDVLPRLVHGDAPALLVMGAYGHSRLREFILGSTTTTLLRTSPVPVLVLR